MTVVKCVTGFLFISSVLAGDSLVGLKMDKSSIAPDFIDVAPSGVLQISYPSGVTVDQGNELTPTQVKDQPTLQWDADDGSLYTVLMFDPDAPAEYSQVRHWLVVNVPGNNISEGKSVVDYVGSGPPKGTGIHRYIFLIFKQSNYIETDVYISDRTRKGRTQTNTRDLIKEYNLGNPVAGNYYRAQYDDYVPILHSRYEDSPGIPNVPK